MPISFFTTSLASSGRRAVPYLAISASIQSACTARLEPSLRLVLGCWPLRISAIWAPCFFRRAGEDGQTHDLDQADVFLFNVVVFPVRVEDAVGVLLARAVVAQGQVKDVALGLVVVQDRRHGVVGRAVGLGQNADALVGVAAPGGQDVVGNILHLLAAAAHQTHGGDRPVRTAALTPG